MNLRRTFIRRVSYFFNTKTKATRKHIVIPSELNDFVGRICKMEYDEEENKLTIFF
jgi:hypothetical protein